LDKNGVERRSMAEEEKREEREDIGDEELEEQASELLPDREAMSVISPPGHTLPIEPPATE
jgi:hypothetical protein